MIPFDILSGEIITEDKMKMEIRILELSPDSFSFRLPLNYLNTHGQIENINLSFFSWEEGNYEDLSIDEFISEFVSDDEFSETFRIRTDNKMFTFLSKRLSKEYLKYIDLKTNYSDEELSYNLTKYYLNTGDFCSDVSEQMLYWVKDLQDYKNDFFCLDNIKEFGVSLENNDLYSLFLKYDMDDFVIKYYKRWNMENHILAKCDYSRILVGNSYCFNLFPDISVLDKILNKAKMQGVNVTIVLPPISQTNFSDACDLLNRVLHEYVCEIQVNDIGTASFIKDNYPDAVISFGPFLNKARRDPRKIYAIQYKNKEYTNLMCDEKTVYYPFYQINTGTFCPLYATIVNGKRGTQERVKYCQGLCENNHFIYPRNLNIIGKYNSLLGFEKRLNGYRERLVVNLW